MKHEFFEKMKSVNLQSFEGETAKTIFVSAISWYRNNVWHGKDEKPPSDDIYLVRHHFGNSFQYELMCYESKSRTFHHPNTMQRVPLSHIHSWRYLEDLD